jgi:hypothetical protein
MSDLANLSDDDLRARVRDARVAFRAADAELTRRQPKTTRGTPRIGGSFAPPLTDEKLAVYRALIDGMDAQSPVRDAMEALYNCAAAWWEQPESVGDGKPHGSGRGTIVALDKPVADALWDAVPWDGQKLDDGSTAPRECDMYAELFDGLPAGEVRNAAFHLLWHAKELSQDREPITADKL